MNSLTWLKIEKDEVSIALGSWPAALEQTGLRGQLDQLAEPELDRVGEALRQERLKLAEGLKARRQANGVTQVKLAQTIKSSQSRVAKMESGNPTVSLDLLVRSILALGASNRELAAIIARN